MKLFRSHKAFVREFRRLCLLHNAMHFTSFWRGGKHYWTIHKGEYKS